MPLKWYGPQLAAHVDQKASDRVRAAGIHLKRRIRESLSVANNVKGKRGANPSKPGQYPKKMLGHLRRNVQDEHSGGVSRVGTNVIYGKWLEIGTRKMKPRPWLSKALRDFGSEIKKILETGAL